MPFDSSRGIFGDIRNSRFFSSRLVHNWTIYRIIPIWKFLDNWINIK